MSTLTEYRDLEQNTDEWLALRLGLVTASTVKSLITAKTVQVASNIDQRSLLRTLVAERVNGWGDDNFQSFDMMMGHVNEPIARDLYAEHYGVTVDTCGFMVREWQYKTLTLGYSPDGLVDDDGLIEVKSRKPKEHIATVLSGEVPSENMAQIQAGLLVSGRSWCDYLSICPGMPLYPIRVLPDEKWREAILDALEAFETEAADMEAKYRANVVGLPMTQRTELRPLDDEITVTSDAH